MSEKLNQVVCWADGDWMWKEDFEWNGGWEGCMSHKSDDYEYLDIPLDVETKGEEAVAEYVHSHVNRGFKE